MSKKQITTIYITETQHKTLKALHDRTKVPVAEIIRQGIDLILDKYKSHLPGQIEMPLPSSMQIDQLGAKVDEDFATVT
jgi:hypothetical protein